MSEHERRVGLNESFEVGASAQVAEQADPRS
jgi:hypothetical protein